MSFADLYKDVTKFRKVIATTIISNTNIPYGILRDNIIMQMTSLIDTNYTIESQEIKLYKIYDTLTGSYAKLYLPKEERAIFPLLINQFFNIVCNIEKPDTHFRYFPTRMYETFIKGITVFDSDIIEQKPSYHRINSCGSKNVKFEDKFAIQPTDTNQEKRRKIEALKTCIIERKIYDAIFHKILHPQNLGHEYELMNLERLYATLTVQRIDVSVMFRDDIVPHTVFVRAYRKNSLITVTSYEKRSDGTVLVERYNDKPTILSSSFSPIKHGRVSTMQTFLEKTSLISSKSKETKSA